MSLVPEDRELDPPTHWNGSGPWVIRDAADGRYIGREPNGNTPARLCWPTKLNRHVMHFPTMEAAEGYIRDGKDPCTESPRYIKVRPGRFVYTTARGLCRVVRASSPAAVLAEALRRRHAVEMILSRRGEAWIPRGRGPKPGLDVVREPDGDCSPEHVAALFARAGGGA